MSHGHPPRNLGLDLVRATEAAALSAGRYIGFGNREEAYRPASQAMAEALKTLDMDGRIVIGEEGRLGEHSPLDTGLHVGTGNGPEMDVVVDPIDGAGYVAQGLPGAISVVGVTPRGCLWSPAPALYMDKIVVDREVARALVPECMGAPAAWTLALVARIKKKAIGDLVAFVLNRPRHADLIEEIRRAGARIFLRPDGDVTGALMAADPRSGVDIMMGIGGAAQGIIIACAVKALGGAYLARLAPQSREEREAIASAGLDTRRVLTGDDIVTSNEIFVAATGITDSAVLDGVHYRGAIAETDSLILRSETGTRRRLRAEHQTA